MTTVATELLAKLKAAVAAANEAEGNLVSRSKQVGLLLLEAKKLHPAVKDFEAFLKRVDGLHRSRAYDLLRLAGGRITDEELKEDARVRKQKSRKKKQPRPAPTSEPEPDSVTSRKEAKSRQGMPPPDNAASARALAEFTFACRTYLPKMNWADQRKAYELVNDLESELSVKAEAA